MAKSNITLPPKRKEDQPIADEKKISEVINRGGSPTKQPESSGKEYKNFNIKILESELQNINELRGKRPRPRGQKRPGISLQDWIIEAINEKIQRETEFYNT